MPIPDLLRPLRAIRPLTSLMEGKWYDPILHRAMSMATLGGVVGGLWSWGAGGSFWSGATRGAVYSGMGGALWGAGDMMGRAARLAVENTANLSFNPLTLDEVMKANRAVSNLAQDATARATAERLLEQVNTSMSREAFTRWLSRRQGFAGLRTLWDVAVSRTEATPQGMAQALLDVYRREQLGAAAANVYRELSAAARAAGAANA